MSRKTWIAFLLCVLVHFAKVDGMSLIARKPLTWLGGEVNGKLGTWSAWGTWSICSEKRCCRHGVSLRRRSCANEPCTGIESEAEDCPKTHCKGSTIGIRDLKQTRMATALNKQLNFTVKNKPHTTNYMYCIFEAYL